MNRPADILQTVARKLGETFDLDRCSVFPCGSPPRARLVASYEDRTLRNVEVDLARYPELRRAIESGETVLIADAGTDPSMRLAWPMLTARQVRSVKQAHRFEALLKRGDLRPDDRAADELDRLSRVAMTVFAEQGSR